MCYKSPGPRCSGHAKAILTSALEKYDYAVKAEDFEGALNLIQEVEDARKNYYMTPSGQKELQRRIENEGDETGELASHLEFGVSSRKAALQQLKAHDIGDVQQDLSDGKGSRLPEGSVTAPSEAHKAAVREKVNVDLDLAYHAKMKAEKAELENVNAARQRAGLRPYSTLSGHRNLTLDEDTQGYSTYDSKLIPQSPDLEKVGSVVDAVHNGANTASALGDTFDMSSRDGSYYSGGAEYLGLIDRTEGYDGQMEYRLTPNGEMYREADAIGRTEIIREMVNSTPLMQEYHASKRDRKTLIKKIMDENYAESVAERRASALATWDRKVNSVKTTFASDMSNTTADVRKNSVAAASRSKAEREERFRLISLKSTVKDFGTCNSCFMKLPATGVCGSCDD